MRENQQPLTEEPIEPVQPVSEQPEAPVLPAENDIDDLIQTADDTAEEPVKEEDIDPADVKIFGLRRVCFHATAFGVAGGYIVTGLIGIAGFTAPNANICAIICGALGYFIGSRLYKKQKAARDAAEHNPENAE